MVDVGKPQRIFHHHQPLFVEGYDLMHELVERSVVTILDSVQQIPYASRVEGTQDQQTKFQNRNQRATH
jgi:hypothetical protein